MKSFKKSQKKGRSLKKKWAIITETTNIDVPEGINVMRVGRQQRALKLASRMEFRDMWTQAFRANSKNSLPNLSKEMRLQLTKIILLA